VRLPSQMLTQGRPNQAGATGDQNMHYTDLT